MSPQGTLSPLIIMAQPRQINSIYSRRGCMCMHSEKQQERVTPEEWRKKTERRKKKQEDILPKESDIYEMGAERS